MKTFDELDEEVQRMYAKLVQKDAQIKGLTQLIAELGARVAAVEGLVRIDG